MLGIWVKILEFAGILFINWKVTSKQTVPDYPIFTVISRVSKPDKCTSNIWP